MIQRIQTDYIQDIVTSIEDIEEFINCKSVEGELANFNISLQFTDSFLSACLNDTEISLIDPKDGSVVRVVQARSLMRKAAEGAWNNGEPGACYIDAVNRDNPTPHLGEINSSNPCGEYYSSPSYNSCTLGSINLTRYVMVNYRCCNCADMEVTTEVGDYIKEEEWNNLAKKYRDGNWH